MGVCRRQQWSGHCICVERGSQPCCCVGGIPTHVTESIQEAREDAGVSFFNCTTAGLAANTARADLRSIREPEDEHAQSVQSWRQDLESVVADTRGHEGGGDGCGGGGGGDEAQGEMQESVASDTGVQGAAESAGRHRGRGAGKAPVVARDRNEGQGQAKKPKVIVGV